MDELMGLESSQWAVRTELTKDGKVQSVSFITGMTYADAWVKSREVEASYLECGWHKRAWTLGNHETNEIVMVSVVFKPNVETEEVIPF